MKIKLENDDGSVSNFILEPVVKEEVRTRCNEFTPGRVIQNRCCMCGEEEKDHAPAQPPRPEELRFSIEQIKCWLSPFARALTAIQFTEDTTNGIAKITKSK